MPNYVKFMKEILSKKKMIAEEGIVSLTITCSAVIQRSLSAKMKDLDSFTIPCSIGKYEFKKALCDSGANINLMPISMVQRLSLGELALKTIILQMADRSMVELEGVIEDQGRKIYLTCGLCGYENGRRQSGPSVVRKPLLSNLSYLD